MEDVAVIGVGITPFGRFPKRRPESLAAAAVGEAVADAAITVGDIDAAFAGTVELPPGTGQKVLKDIGFAGIPIVNVENACASSTTALRDAIAWIRAGFADVCLVIGVESLSRTMTGPVAMDLDDPVGGEGMVWPAVYAMKARAYMHQNGATPEDFAKVAVKNRRHAAANPNAQFQKLITVEEVLASRQVCDPLTLLQCCPTSDGAAALVVASAAVARRSERRPVWVVGQAMASGRLNDRIEVTLDVSSRMASAAYEQAGIGPADIQVAEVHDAFTPAEILHYEALGFAAEGEGYRYVDKAALGGGGTVVSASGGLLSRGHPLGATGAAQIVELTRQLRGEAGTGQVEDARFGVAHVMGGTIYDLESNACVVTVLRGDRL